MEAKKIIEEAKEPVKKTEDQLVTEYKVTTRSLYGVGNIIELTLTNKKVSEIKSIKEAFGIS